MTRQASCIAFLYGNDLEFYFENADVEIQLDIIANMTCQDYNESLRFENIPKCAAAEYDKVAYGAPELDVFGDVEGLYYSDSLHCSPQCTCQLEDKEWIETCIDKITTSLIIYADYNGGISFADTGLSGITNNAFNSISQVTSLKLQRNYLGTLPDDLFESMSLYNLDLSDNFLTLLTPGLFDSLASLQLLNLSFNLLAELHEDTFISQHSLVVLNLQSNQLTQLPPNIFKSLHALRMVLLGNNFLTTLPVKLFYFCKSLERIDLNFNQISNIYEGMFDIEHLKQKYDYARNRMDYYLLIDLSDNYLVSIEEKTFWNANVSQLLMHNNPILRIPARVFQPLHMLRQIGLRNTSLEMLPEGLLDSQIDLEHLDLGHNYLETLPRGIFDNLFNLLTLKLNNNRLVTLPNAIFMSLQNVTVLDLGFNRLSYLPDSILSLDNLKMLDLVDNDLIAFETDILSNCFNLDIIRLDINNLSTVPQTLFNSSYYVRTIFLSQNRIEVIYPGTFDTTIGLENLELSYNSLESLPNFIFHSVTVLQYLNLSHNNLPLVPSFKTLSRLRILDISNNKLVSFVSKTFIGLEDLEYLSISSNFIAALPDGIFDNLGSLIFLDMSNNLLKHVQSGLFLFQSKLVTLILSRNALTNVPSDAFHGLESLLRMDLDYNNISHLQGQTFNGLKRTSFLNLSQNHLAKLDAGVLDFSLHLETLDLRNNNLFLVQTDSFLGVETTNVLVDEFATCCFMNEHSCVSKNPRPAYLTCKRMLPEVTLRISMWCLGISAVLFNGFAFYTRRKGDMFVQNILISHLAISDFLMGINMIFLAAADFYFGDFFPSYSNRWRFGIPCKIAGVLSLLSSEASVFFITMISVDRFLGVKYPFSARRLNLRSAQQCAIVLWLVTLLLSIVPLILSSFVRDVFEVSEVCVGIPMVKRPITTIETDSVELAITEFRANIDYSSNYSGNQIETVTEQGTEQMLIYPKAASAHKRCSGERLNCVYPINPEN
ncbi:uncharacterized protein [Amphiura filiformis]|uniref:uncharacterized protein n=1 Tax=Amphiura filiformis TaxID=82378 RepID=UPI003B222C3E